MNRREFLRTLGRFGFAAGAASALGWPFRLFSQENLRSGSPENRPAGEQGIYDLAAVMGGEPAAMFDAGIAALGGIKSFVRPGQTVVIKPNASWNVSPDRGATTTPSLVRRIAEHCRDAAASKVYILDHTIDNWKLAYATTGIEGAAKTGGGQVVPANSKGYYQEAVVPGAGSLKKVLVHELILEADVVINVPVLKHHGSTTITSAMKNLMGVVWDRSYYHSTDLHRCIAEFGLLRTPTLNVVDAHTVMMSGGPRGSSYRSSLSVKKMQILSADIVAADAAAAKTWGIEPEKVRYIVQADGLRLGSMDLDSLRIARIRV